ncbi:MAG: superoxide dismutase family protein [Gemmatimonadaceae bacterium]
MRHTAWAVSVLLLGACSSFTPQGRRAAAAVDRARAELADASGRKIGDATLQQTPRGVLLTLDLSGAPAGTRAIHLHNVGECEAPFETAGEHVNPGGRAHGMRNAAGAHAGDLPNLFVPESGVLRQEILVSGVTLTARNSALLDEDGSAIVMHASADDYVTDPSGGSGERVACGVIKRESGSRR